jgi:hypothetical protein
MSQKVFIYKRNHVALKRTPKKPWKDPKKPLKRDLSIKLLKEKKPKKTRKKGKNEKLILRKKQEEMRNLRKKQEGKKIS